MNRATPRMRRFAESLLAQEPRRKGWAGSDTVAVFVIVEKLRPSLATLMGQGGFRALLSRALALANPEVAWLRAVNLKADGAFAGLDEAAAQASPEDIAEGGVVLLAQLLGLMVAFIGENLTLRLVRDVWPKLSFNDPDSGPGDKK